MLLKIPLYKKNKSLQLRMIFLYSLLIIIFVLLIGSVSILTFSNIIEKTTINYTFQIISQVNSNIGFYFEEMEQIANIANYHYDIQKRLKQQNWDDSTMFYSTHQISDFLDDMANMREDIEAILVFANDGSVIVNNHAGTLNKNYNFKRQSWYKKAIQARGSSVTIKPHKQSYISDSSNLVFSLSRSINNFDSDEQIGIILIDLNLEALSSICSNVELGEEGYIMIIDNESNVIYHPDYSYMYRSWDEMYLKEIFKSDDLLIQYALENESGSFKKVIDGETKLVLYDTMPSTGWTILGIVPQSFMAQQQEQISLFIGLLGILCICAAILITFFLSSHIFKPITKLRDKMALAEQGDLNVSATTAKFNEISALNSSFNRMISRIKTLMTKVVEEEQEKRKAELKALQAQINPHFLYNTLDSIIWMAESNRKEVVIMADSLAKLFRLSLSKGRQFITIGEEIEHVRNYLIIQSMRYVDKFNYVIDVDEELLNLQSLKLILQPIVENAIYHGIKNKRQKGNILIKGRLFFGDVILQVMDDGIGMNNAELKNILTGNSKNKGFNGVGVRNVNERIKLYYGKQYGIEFVSEKDIGTVVGIWFPAIPYEEDNK